MSSPSIAASWLRLSVSYAGMRRGEAIGRASPPTTTGGRDRVASHPASIAAERAAVKKRRDWRQPRSPPGFGQCWIRPTPPGGSQQFTGPIRRRVEAHRELQAASRDATSKSPAHASRPRSLHAGARRGLTDISGPGLQSNEKHHLLVNFSLPQIVVTTLSSQRSALRRRAGWQRSRRARTPPAAGVLRTAHLIAGSHRTRIGSHEHAFPRRCDSVRLYERPRVTRAAQSPAGFSSPVASRLIICSCLLDEFVWDPPPGTRFRPLRAAAASRGLKARKTHIRGLRGGVLNHDSK